MSLFDRNPFARDPLAGMDLIPPNDGARARSRPAVHLDRGVTIDAEFVDLGQTAGARPARYGEVRVKRPEANASSASRSYRKTRGFGGWGRVAARGTVAGGLLVAIALPAAALWSPGAGVTTPTGPAAFNNDPVDRSMNTASVPETPKPTATVKKDAAESAAAASSEALDNAFSAEAGRIFVPEGGSSVVTIVTE